MVRFVLNLQPVLGTLCARWEYTPDRTPVHYKNHAHIDTIVFTPRAIHLASEKP